MPRRASFLAPLAAALALAAAAAAAAPARKEPQLPLSAKQCWEPPAPQGTPPDARPAWCRVSNLYLYRGAAYFLTENATEQLPTVQYGNSPRVPQAITPGQLHKLLPLGVRRLAVERAYLFRSFAQAACTDDDSYVNFGDGMTERIVTLWLFLCEVMGQCSYADRSGLQLIDASRRACRPADPPSGREAYPAWYRQVLSCMSDQPLRHLNGSWRDSLVAVRAAWVGLGPRCRSHYGHCHDGSRGKQGPTPELLAAWRRTLGACLGFSTDKPAPLDPVRVMLVDRLYESHRHLLNVNTLLRALRGRYDPRRVRVSLQYMEGLPVAEQFRLWAQQTVVVHVHGSNIGHWQGLPQGAVVVKVAPFRDTYNDAAYGDYLVRDYGPVSNLTWVPLVNTDPSRLHLATEHRSLDDPRYRAFTDGEKLALLRADCASLPGKAKQKACELALKFGTNLVAPPEELVPAVDEAIRQAFAKQGRAPPPDVLLRPEAAFLNPAAGPEFGDRQQQQHAAMARGAAWAWQRGQLHLPSVIVGAAAAAGLFLALRVQRHWLQLVSGRRKAARGGGSNGSSSGGAPLLAAAR